MSGESGTNPFIPLAVLAGVYYMSTLDDEIDTSEDEEYPMSHIILYCGFLYCMREHLGAPEILAIMAPIAASNLARAMELSYVKSTLAALAALLLIRHMKGDLTKS